MWKPGAWASHPSPRRVCDALAVLEDALTVESETDPSAARALPGVALSVLPVLVLVALLAGVIGVLGEGGHIPLVLGTAVAAIGAHR